MMISCYIFVSRKINEKNSTEGINFQIERVRSKTNSETSDTKFELSSLLQNGSHQQSKEI